MNKNGVIAVVVVVISIVLVGLWAMRSGEQGMAGEDCTAPPNAPTGVTPAVQGSQVTIRWQPNSGESVQWYQVEATTDRAVAPTVFLAPGNSTSFSREAPPATYYVTVSARNACGTSPRSEEMTVTVTP